jgi:hypothetical protein
MGRCYTLKNPPRPWAKEFCDTISYNVRTTCDENNSIEEIENGDCDEFKMFEGDETEYVCVFLTQEPDRGKTKCIPESLCNYCNDPFGLFGYSSVAEGKWEDVGDEYDEDDFGRAPRYSYLESDRDEFEPCIYLDFCYMDYSYTNINRFYQYPENVSCYDFHSLNACREFNRTLGGESCEWEWHPLYRELGIGVCRSSIIDEQDCEACHDPMNKVFARCDRETCALYGRCYYDKENLPEDDFAPLADMTTSGIPGVLRADKVGSYFYKCTHEREISCENYDLMEDCINSSSPYSIQGANALPNNVDVDVNGFIEDNDYKRFKKLSGSNIVETESDDFFGFGKCQWVLPRSWNKTKYNDTEWSEITEINYSTPELKDYKCFKNSDDSPPQTVYWNFTKSERFDFFLYSDCRGLGGEEEPSLPPLYGTLDLFDDILNCRKDFINPVTTVPHYYNETDPMRISGNFEFVATVFDESTDYSWYYPDTYACIANMTFYCYPNSTATKEAAVGNIINRHNIGRNVSYEFNETEGFESGYYKIRYFSEDVSHNLEEINEFPVYLDSDPPNIVLHFSNYSFELEEDVWRTNLTLIMNVEPRYPEDDQFAFCNAALYVGEAHMQKRM